MKLRNAQLETALKKKNEFSQDSGAKNLNDKVTNTIKHFNGTDQVKDEL